PLDAERLVVRPDLAPALLVHRPAGIGSDQDERPAAEGIELGARRLGQCPPKAAAALSLGNEDDPDPTGDAVGAGNPCSHDFAVALGDERPNVGCSTANRKKDS